MGWHKSTTITCIFWWVMWINHKYFFTTLTAPPTPVIVWDKLVTPNTFHLFLVMFLVRGSKGFFSLSSATNKGELGMEGETFSTKHWLVLKGREVILLLDREENPNWAKWGSILSFNIQSNHCKNLYWGVYFTTKLSIFSTHLVCRSSYYPAVVGTTSRKGATSFDASSW